ncbi:hypothetical protein A3Q56_06812 [Intoshia linei]|uniref:Uncharacterized protein n=1 Tax=Intoshia linei TaxID=1819745 RepID=A0A177ATR5_9BILA|nr:hypothetical protein A3Q56_06812 [Intoshia linei]
MAEDTDNFKIDLNFNTLSINDQVKVNINEAFYACWKKVNLFTAIRTRIENVCKLVCSGQKYHQTVGKLFANSKPCMFSFLDIPQFSNAALELAAANSFTPFKKSSHTRGLISRLYDNKTINITSVGINPASLEPVETFTMKPILIINKNCKSVRCNVHGQTALFLLYGIFVIDNFYTHTNSRLVRPAYVRKVVIVCMQWSENGNLLAIGLSNGSHYIHHIKLYNIKTGKIKIKTSDRQKTENFKGIMKVILDFAVTTLACNKSLIAAGTSKGNVYIVDTKFYFDYQKYGKIINTTGAEYRSSIAVQDPIDVLGKCHYTRIIYPRHFASKDEKHEICLWSFNIDDNVRSELKLQEKNAKGKEKGVLIRYNRSTAWSNELLFECNEYFRCCSTLFKGKVDPFRSPRKDMRTLLEVEKYGQMCPKDSNIFATGDSLGKIVFHDTIYRVVMFSMDLKHEISYIIFNHFSNEFVTAHGESNMVLKLRKMRNCKLITAIKGDNPTVYASLMGNREDVMVGAPIENY